MSKRFKTFEIVHVPREENVWADFLAKFISTKKLGLNRTVIQETLDHRSTKVEYVMMIENRKSWMTLIIEYLTK